MAWRVLITARDFYETPEAIAVLRAAGCDIVESKYGRAYGDGLLDGDELVSLLEGVEGMIAGTCRMTRQTIERSPSLKIISRRGVGFDSIDLDAARDRNILVSTTAGTNHEAVADHAFALLLAAARGVTAGQRCIDEGGWTAHLGVSLPGKTLGIIGLGRVGKAVARRASGFDMKVIAHDPVTDEKFARANGVRYVSLDELVSQADFISVNCELNASSRHIIGPRTIALMKPSAIVVNTARGPLVDEHALAEALKNKRILAAGIDVFDEEPPPATPLKGLPNAVLTPHTAGSTIESKLESNTCAAQNVVDYMNGMLPRKDRIVVAAGVQAAR